MFTLAITTHLKKSAMGICFLSFSPIRRQTRRARDRTPRAVVMIFLTAQFYSEAEREFNWPACKKDSLCVGLSDNFSQQTGAHLISNIRLLDRLQIHSELLALLVQMAAFESQRPGRFGHVIFVAFQLGQHQLALE